MVSSVLSPQKIIGQQNRNPEAFKNFLTGNADSLGSSVVESSANKIVGFSRSSVSPVKSDITNLVNNISSNIINNVDNSIKNTTNFIMNDVEKKFSTLKDEVYRNISNIQTEVSDLREDVSKSISNIENEILKFSVQSKTPVTEIQQVVQNIQNQSEIVLDKTIRSFSRDYQQKVKGIEDTKPNNVIQKFLENYKNAIGFVNFFGDSRNIKRVSENLKSLQKLFVESFDTAKVLRQTIVKIVKQLSNLPQATPNAGGLNIDIGVPGNRLKQSAGPSVKNVGRGASLLKYGAIGLGGLGLGAAGMSAAKEFQERKLAESQVLPSTGMVPGSIVDSLSTIIDRFSNAVESLIKGSEKQRQSSSGGGAPSPKPPPAPKPPGEGAGGQLIPGDAPPEIKALMETISGGEGGPNSVQGIGEVPGLSDMTFDQAINTAKSYIGKGSKTGALGSFQFHSDHLRNRAIAAGIDPAKDKFNLENQTKVMRHFQTTVYGASEEKLLESLRSGGLETDVFPKLSKDFGWPSLPGGSQSNVHTPGAPKRYYESLKKYQKQAVVENIPTQIPGVVPAPQQTQQIARTQTISQPAQQAPQMIQLPPQIMDMGSPQQSQGGGEVMSPPPQSHRGPEVPFLPTSNPDNFFVMYSRMVYNIVDG